MVGEFLLGVFLTLAGISITIIGGILAYLFKNLWSMRREIDSINMSYRGDDVESGHLQETKKEFERVQSRLDDFEDSLSYFERKREESHKELCRKMDSIVEVLEEEGLNGDILSDDQS